MYRVSKFLAILLAVGFLAAAEVAVAQGPGAVNAQEVHSSTSLTLSAGGTNQNVTLKPTGSGLSVLNGASATSYNAVVEADTQSGANAGAQIAACIAALPSTGGTCDARGLQGAQTISANVWAGITKPVRVLLGGATYSVSATQVFSSGQEFVGLGKRVSASVSENARTVLQWTGSAGGTMIQFVDATAGGLTDVELDANSSAAVNLQLVKSIGSTWDNHFTRVKFTGSATTAGVRLGAADTSDIAFNVFSDCTFYGGKVNFLDDSSNASFNRIENSQFFGTANTNYNIQINAGILEVGGHTYFTGATVSDIFITGASGNQGLTVIDAYSESTVPFLTTGTNQSLAEPVNLINVDQITGTGNAISYDSGIALNLVGCNFARAISFGVNATNAGLISGNGISVTNGKGLIVSHFDGTRAWTDTGGLNIGLSTGTPTYGSIESHSGYGINFNIDGVTEASINGTSGALSAKNVQLNSGSNFAAQMATPAAPTLTASTSGGTLATGTYFYKITALDGAGTDETVGGTEASVGVTGPSGSVGLSWTAITGAASYRIYRGTTSGSENVYYSSTTNSFTDTGAAGTSASPPSTPSAYTDKINTAGNSWFSGGNVGIGTASPNDALEIASGNLRLSEASPYIVITNSKPLVVSHIDGSQAPVQSAGVNIGLSTGTPTYGNIESSSSNGINFNINGVTEASINGTSGALSAKSVIGLTGAFTPNAAGGTDVGSASLPFANYWLGAAATNNAKLTGTFTAARVFTVPDTASDTFTLNAATQTLTNKSLTSPTINTTIGGSPTFPAPGAIGGTTPAAGTFTTLGANTQLNINGTLADSSTVPTLTGFGTSPSVVASSGTAAFEINVGTGGTASSGTITFPAASHGWAVHCDDVTTQSTSVFATKQTAFTTTTAVITQYSDVAVATAWVASDILVCQARAF